MKRRKSHEEFTKELLEINPDIEAIEQYINARTPITFRCKICGHVWKVPPGNVLRGTGCRQCMIRERTKPVEQFITEVHRKNPPIEVIGEYNNNNTPIRCRCGKCGYEWKPRPSVLLRGGGCPKCAGNAKRTHEEFIEEMKQANPGIEVLGHYVNTDTKIECRCKICGLHFKRTPNCLLHGGGCPNKAHRTKGEQRDE